MLSGGHQSAHPFQYFMDVDAAFLRACVRAKHPFTRFCRRSASPMMMPRIFLQGLVGQFAFEQLRRAAQAAQRILDFVRQARAQRARGLMLRQKMLFAADTQPLVDLQHLDQARLTRYG